MKCHWTTGEGKGCARELLKGTDYCAFHGKVVRTMADAKAKRALEGLDRGAPSGGASAAGPSAIEEGPASSSDEEYLSEEDQAEAGDWEEEDAPVAAARPPMKRARARAGDAPDYTGVDPDVVGAMLVQVALEQERRDSVRPGTGRRDREGRRSAADAPHVRTDGFRIIQRLTELDSTAPVDPVTGGYPEDIEPGWVLRWVSMRDSRDRPSQAGVAHIMRAGYVPVRDANGDPIEDRLGALMQGPPEAYATRALSRMPRGAVHQRDSLEALEEINKDLRQYGGENAGGLFKAPGHGRTRHMVGPREFEQEVG